VPNIRSTVAAPGLLCLTIKTSRAARLTLSLENWAELRSLIGRAEGDRTPDLMTASFTKIVYSVP
jgi:hypothetical protein